MYVHTYACINARVDPNPFIATSSTHTHTYICIHKPYLNAYCCCCYYNFYCCHTSYSAAEQAIALVWTTHSKQTPSKVDAPRQLWTDTRCPHSAHTAPTVIMMSQLQIHVYVYVCMYICIAVLTCVRVRTNLQTHREENNNKSKSN